MESDLEIKTADGQIILVNLKSGKGNAGENQISFSGSALDWYKLTETSRHVLSNVITISVQEQLEELNKANPDQNKISQLEEIALQASKISRDSKNFKSKKRMLEIIANYSNFVL